MTVGSPRRLLLQTGNLSLLRSHYGGVVLGLARAGVQIDVRYLSEKWLTVDEYRAHLRKDGIEDAVTVERFPRTARDPDELLALRLRQLGNLLRYSHEDYAGLTFLQGRLFDKATPGVNRWARRITRLGPRPARAVARVLAGVERLVPPSRSGVALIAETMPHAVAALPVMHSPALVDYLKAAAREGIATSIWVQSWDNLTNKGLLHFNPSRTFVWNEAQVRELGRYHGVPAERVCITGAQTFDHWFDGEPVADRDNFCSRNGIEPGRPILLYFASSEQVAPNEPEFFRRWLRAIRSSGDDVLRSATVLVRPHPTLAPLWHTQGLEREPGVTVSPSTIRDAINSDGFRRQYREELYHGSVAVGVNTSGLIDAAIFGKPACSVELPELFQGQHGTLHYRHLVEGEPGLLRTASSLEEHTAMLAELVRRDSYAQDVRSLEFVRRFVRPRGLDVKPADVFVEEMLELCRRPAQPARASVPRRLAGRLLSSAAVVVGAPLEERPFERVLAHTAAAAIVAFYRLRALRTPATRL